MKKNRGLQSHLVMWSDLITHQRENGDLTLHSKLFVRTQTLGVITLIALIGCGKSNPLGAIPVRGTVTYKGQPLSEGEVLYNPVDTKGRRAKGKIQSDGSFRLTTLETNDGAIPGEYQISVLAYAPHPGEPSRTVESEQRDQIRERIKRGHIIPERYTDPETSGLTDVVDKSHSGIKEINLED